VNALKVRSCLIDGESVAYDENGLAVFELRVHRTRWRLAPSVRGDHPKDFLLFKPCEESFAVFFGIWAGEITNACVA
jgi:hypothetical protein